ncbi:SURF1 family protein [Streptomyces caatingaensis]|uniref:SURF1-like protein n=1 Tax=Streptomyces caatingaensis TaxID=1678637 RepID=A0A0K9XGL9_9ACTN|nr:SURF1 family protein [Streptomyces caatingaensis]KNB52535.1 membrane protein [Streptomyces caatingaensis]
MYRFLLTRQWVILTLVGLVLIPVMIKLGFWQLHRHEQRVARNNQIGRSLEHAPVPVTDLTAPGREVAHENVWRRVTAKGSYDPKGEVVVRLRTDNSGKSGFMVVTPFVLEGGEGDGKAVLVNRGWIPADAGQRTYPKVPAPPSGRIELTGRLRADEDAGEGIRDTKGLPPRMIMIINSGRQAKELHRPVLGGYLELISPAGKGQPQTIDDPDHSSIGNHMAYTVQWWLFSAFVPVGWVILVRRERRDRLAAASSPAEPVPAATG